jgi:hypothetical protein
LICEYEQQGHHPTRCPLCDVESALERFFAAWLEKGVPWIVKDDGHLGQESAVGIVVDKVSRGWVQVSGSRPSKPLKPSEGANALGMERNIFHREAKDVTDAKYMLGIMLSHYLRRVRKER